MVTNVQYTEDDYADVAEPRTVAAIRRDAGDVADTIDRHLRPVRAAREKLRQHLDGHAEGGDAWRAVIDEHLPALYDAESDTRRQLDGIRTRLRNDRRHLADAGYQSGLTDAEREQADVKATAITARLATLSASHVRREMDTAILHNDRTAMSAWAMLADAVEARFPATTTVTDATGQTMPARALLRDALRTCERQTMDRAALEARDTLEGALQSINEAISGIDRAIAAHEPDRAGSVLVGWQFGASDGDAEKRRRELRYSPEAVAARLGR